MEDVIVQHAEYDYNDGQHRQESYAFFFPECTVKVADMIYTAIEPKYRFETYASIEMHEQNSPHDILPEDRPSAIGRLDWQPALLENVEERIKTFAFLVYENRAKL